MFSSFARRLTASPAPTEPPKPAGPKQPTRLTLVRDPEEQLVEYEKVAAGLNFSPSDLFERKVRNFLIEEDIPIYSYQEVFDYMARICRKVQKSWQWAPLADSHVGRMVAITNDEGVRFDKSSDPVYLRGGAFREQTYTRLVPAQHLKNARRIRDKFGERVEFFVSDFAVPNPDPFIAVYWLGLTEPIVFGVWDEPGFGG